jgi:transcriptional regulator with XRE-family HTH domain
MARTLSRPDFSAIPLAPDLLALGRLVRNKRLEQSMRIDDAAALIGVSANVLSRLENGHPVGSDRLFKILDGLGLNMLVVAKADSPAALRALSNVSSQTMASQPPEKS